MHGGYSESLGGSQRQAHSEKSKANIFNFGVTQRKLKKLKIKYSRCCMVVNDAKAAFDEQQDHQADLPAPKKKLKIAEKIRRAEKQHATERARELIEESVIILPSEREEGEVEENDVWLDMKQRQMARLSTAVRLMASNLLEINFTIEQARETAIRVTLEMPPDGDDVITVTPEVLRRFLLEEEQAVRRKELAASCAPARAMTAMEKELQELRTEREVQAAKLRVVTQEKNQALK